jgi:hypothetical protein
MNLSLRLVGAFWLFCIGTLQADTNTVVINCNGQSIPNLPIQVVDATGLVVSGVSITDKEGLFVISNSETYVTPFRLLFNTPNGSVCGPYRVFQTDLNHGRVDLNYYPTNLPCSCSQFVH